VNTKEYSDQLLKYGTRYLEDGFRAWERYLQSFNKAGAEFKITDAQQRFTDFAFKDGAEAMRKLMHINYDYYMSLMNAYLEFSESALNRSHQSAKGEVAPVATEGNEAISVTPATHYKHIDLHFSAKTRRLQKEAFVVANKNPADVDVSFEISELICEDGKTSTVAPVTFEPDHFTLNPGEEQVVECRLKLTKALKEGLQYVALTRVVGFEDLFVRLIVNPENASAQ
jgi:hypothetical protein